MIQPSLTTQTRANSNCVNCYLPIDSSKYQDQKIAFRKAKTAYLCVRCAQIQKRVTVDDLDNYLRGILRLKNGRTKGS